MSTVHDRLNAGKRLLEAVRARGFDRSYQAGKYVSVRCTQCEALVIQGHPTHEAGCPNATHECRGCNAIIGARQTYCQDCQN